MAKRASLTFDALKGAKGQAEAPPAPEPAAAPAEREAMRARGRGRPRLREPDAKVYGMTLRMSGDRRKALRRQAEDETETAGRVVSVHDVILAAVDEYLARHGGR